MMMIRLLGSLFSRRLSSSGNSNALYETDTG
jgi:hypothetical protein